MTKDTSFTLYTLSSLDKVAELVSLLSPDTKSQVVLTGDAVGYCLKNFEELPTGFKFYQMDLKARGLESQVERENQIDHNELIDLYIQCTKQVAW